MKHVHVTLKKEISNALNYRFYEMHLIVDFCWIFGYYYVFDNSYQIFICSIEQIFLVANSTK